MTLHARGFEFEPEFTAKILKRKVRIFEVPITFNPAQLHRGEENKDDTTPSWRCGRY